MFKNHILPPIVVRNLYCPECSSEVELDASCMVEDNHWILEFDVHLAKGCLRAVRIDSHPISPAFLFDEGYASWNGLTPNELDQRSAERREIIPLADKDMRLYLAEMKRWGCERAQKLREAGWRKAQRC